ncbi:MAG: hypothetical protein EBU08_09570 [Micrococcales bacterium]|nr:hypothetical protein [Micrococcales bacterium]
MFETSTHTFRTLRPKDTDFNFSPDGITLIPRAGIEISNNCPDNYFQILQTCINKGWIKPVAHMRDTEYTMELLYK